MTAIGLELLNEPDLLQAAKEELVKGLNGRRYKSLLNMDLSKLIGVAAQDCKGQGEEFVSGIDAKQLRYASPGASAVDDPELFAEILRAARESLQLLNPS